MSREDSQRLSPVLKMELLFCFLKMELLFVWGVGWNSNICSGAFALPNSYAPPFQTVPNKSIFVPDISLFFSCLWFMIDLSVRQGRRQILKKYCKILVKKKLGRKEVYYDEFTKCYGWNQKQ